MPLPTFAMLVLVQLFLEAFHVVLYRIDTSVLPVHINGNSDRGGVLERSAGFHKFFDGEAASKTKLYAAPVGRTPNDGM